MKKSIRSYKLKLCGNNVKSDTARYTIRRFNQYANTLMGKCFFGQNIYTTGMGGLANKAGRRAWCITHTQRRLQAKTHCKINVPYVSKLGCPAIIEKSKNTFQYWIAISNEWDGRKMVRLPANSHKALNRAIRNGWILKSVGECKIMGDSLYAIVYVTKVMPKQKKYKKIIGCDIGIKHSIVTSDGYLGHGLSKIIKTQKRRQAERRRQGHKVSNKTKSCIKQILDREAKLLIGRSIGKRASIAVESPNRMGGLCRGNLQGWASSYFANRLTILGREFGIMVIEVSPYQTSITCPKCKEVDKRSRVMRDTFKCIKCNYTGHADKVAALNIARKASEHQDGKILNGKT